MSQIQEWRYAHDADITFGEVHVSPLPKILLGITVFILIVACGSGYILRDYLYDLILNPHIVLKSVEYDEASAKYFVNVPYKYNFDAEKFIDELNTLEYDSFMDNTNENYLYSITGDVNTQVLGDYTVTYSSSNRMSTKDTELLVRVKDITAPYIKLNATLNEAGEYEPIILVRGKTSDDKVLGTEDFNARSYLITVKDDYDKTKDVRIEHTGDSINFGASGTTTVSVIYTATDKAGNTSQVSLPLVIMEDYDAAAAEMEDRISKMEEELAKLQQRQNNRNNSSSSNNNGGSNSNSSSGGGASSGGVSLVADDFTWSVSSQGDVTTMISNSYKYVHYRGNGQAAPIDGPGMTYQIDGPGTYTMTWQCTEGLTATQRITITE